MAFGTTPENASTSPGQSDIPSRRESRASREAGNAPLRGSRMSLETLATAASTIEGSCNPARDRPTKRLVRSAVPRVPNPDKTNFWNT